MRALTRKRISEIERAEGVGDGFLVITVVGGFQQTPLAEAGDVEWKPDPGENLADFQRRVIGAARETGAKVLVFSGFPHGKSRAPK